ncbi:MAG: hypothetical protein LBQ79_10220 [Deltaproteobacteria bacterium]|jgi:hypothetical protein|nr:hypothetical protein [Deltaproteobacteria bacterium]
MDDSRITDLPPLLEHMPMSEPRDESRDEPYTPEAGSDPFRNLPDEFRIPLGLLRELNTELKLQVKRLTTRLDKRTAEFRDKTEEETRQRK